MSPEVNACLVARVAERFAEVYERSQVAFKIWTATREDSDLIAYVRLNRRCIYLQRAGRRLMNFPKL